MIGSRDTRVMGAGHSTATAEKHYLQVTEDHWQAGAVTATGAATKEAESGGITGGLISVNLGQSNVLNGTAHGTAKLKCARKKLCQI